VFWAADLFGNLKNSVRRFLPGFLQGSTLNARGMRAVVFLGAGTGFDRVLKLVRNMILARLLMPEQFGVLAKVMVVTTALDAFVDVGVRQLIIQHKEGDNKKFLNTAWWFQFVRGLILFAIGFAAAPYIERFYGTPGLAAMLRVAFLVVVCNSMLSPGAHVLERNIQYGRWVLMSQAGGFVGTAVSLILAFTILPNTWAIVIGFTSEGISRLIVSFIVCPFLPALSFDISSLKEIVNYGKRMFGVPLLALFASMADVLILGKVVNDAALGIYSLALQLAVQPDMFYSKIIAPVLLPVFAKKQDDNKLLREAVIRVARFTALIAMPFTVFLVIYSKQVLGIIWGNKYITAAIPFGLLCCYGFIRMQGQILSQVYFAIGRPNLQRRFVVLRLLLLLLFLYPASKAYGLVGAAGVVLGANLVGFIMQVHWVGKSTGLEFFGYWRAWRDGVLLSGVVFVPTLVLTTLDVKNSMVGFVIGVCMCLAAIAAAGIIVLKDLRRKGKLVSEV